MKKSVGNKRYKQSVEGEEQNPFGHLENEPWYPFFDEFYKHAAILSWNKKRKLAQRKLRLVFNNDVIAKLKVPLSYFMCAVYYDIRRENIINFLSQLQVYSGSFEANFETLIETMQAFIKENVEETKKQWEKYYQLG